MPSVFVVTVADTTVTTRGLMPVTVIAMFPPFVERAQPLASAPRRRHAPSLSFDYVNRIFRPVGMIRPPRRYTPSPPATPV